MQGKAALHTCKHPTHHCLGAAAQTRPCSLTLAGAPLPLQPISLTHGGSRCLTGPQEARTGS